MSYKKILVGLDQSFKDSAVFAKALELARPHVSSIMLMHTLKGDRELPDRLPIGKHQDDAKDMYMMLTRIHQQRVEQENHKAQKWLQLYFQQAVAKGIPTQIDCRVTSPALWLCELAHRWGADLIVIGHRENQGLKSVGSNSVSQYVLQHSPCSVLVVHSLMQLEELNQIAEKVPVKTMKTPASAILESQQYRV
jgi:nucleotide-binding universal stress UspA family protein